MLLSRYMTSLFYHLYTIFTFLSNMHVIFCKSAKNKTTVSNFRVQTFITNKMSGSSLSPSIRSQGCTFLSFSFLTFAANLRRFMSLQNFFALKLAWVATFATFLQGIFLLFNWGLITSGLSWTSAPRNGFLIRFTYLYRTLFVLNFSIPLSNRLL